MVRLRILGLDPGTERTGWGCIETSDATTVRVASGVLQLGRGDLPGRLRQLHVELERLFTVYQPDACATEGIFHHRHARSALLLGHARGICLLVAAAHGVPVSEYPPARVKSAVAGHGAAGKERVGAFVAGVLRIEPVEIADESDALAIAICHLESARPLRLME